MYLSFLNLAKAEIKRFEMNDVYSSPEPSVTPSQRDLAKGENDLRDK